MAGDVFELIFLYGLGHFIQIHSSTSCVIAFPPHCPHSSFLTREPTGAYRGVVSRHFSYLVFALWTLKPRTVAPNNSQPGEGSARKRMPP